MSKSQFPGFGDDDSEHRSFDEDVFRKSIRDDFASHMKSQQALDAEGIPRSEWNGNHFRRHRDGEEMQKRFRMAPFWKVIERAERQAEFLEEDRTFTQFPSAFLHLVTHLSKWERSEIASENPDPDVFERVPEARAKVLRWFAEDPDARLKRKRPGGTDVLLHGEQGTTKTTAMLWLAAVMMQINNEDCVWVASLDATEWITMAPWTTLCFPRGVDVSITADPEHPAYEGDGVELEPEDVARDVIRYSDPGDLLRQLATRTPGQFYAVYPDPYFRKCESITSWRYHPLASVDRASEATSLWHWIFALYERRLHGPEHNRWMTVFADEVHKFLHRGASKDSHDYYSKVESWGRNYADGRKFQLSAFNGTHIYEEIHPMVLDKLRWGCTMNGESFPSRAPVGGDLRDLTLGQGTFWNKQQWAPLEWPNLKDAYASSAEINVNYPVWEEERDAKSA